MKTSIQATYPIIEELSSTDLADWFGRLSHLSGLLWLDSALVDPRLGRYSFLTADPFAQVTSRDGLARVDSGGRVRRVADPLQYLQAQIARFDSETIEGLPPFQGGIAGLFSYDLCHHFEKLPRASIDEFRIPDLSVGLYDWVIAADHLHGDCWVISTGWPESDPRRRSRRASDRMRWVRKLLSHSSDTRSRSFDRGLGARGEICRDGALGQEHTRIESEQFPLRGWPGVCSDFSRSDYLRTVARVCEYIAAGDIYQVNLAQRLIAKAIDHPGALFLRLRKRNPAPFSGYYQWDSGAIVSASPERFLKLNDRRVETRPIKGTRPRWSYPTADMYSSADLSCSEKDRAENIMIVDLLRNDLGRICQYGSIEVTDPLKIESYEFVHHLVSEVAGTLTSEATALDLLRAAFPGGSITGAPKIRAMEIIAELEPARRGAYCGSLGYMGFDGSMDSSILIRTFTSSLGWLQFPVGGGIVADSSPEREYDETLHKAEGLLRALAE